MVEVSSDFANLNNQNHTDFCKTNDLKFIILKCIKSHSSLKFYFPRTDKWEKVTYCRIDFHQMRPHRWHIGILLAQVALVALNVWIIFCVEADPEQKLLWESVLTCIIGPTATAAPVVTAKIGGNINTMTAYVVISAFASALMIPAVFPLLERGQGLDFMTVFLIILQKLALVLVSPLILGWLVQHYAKRFCAWLVSIPDLSFYLWSHAMGQVSPEAATTEAHTPWSLWNEKPLR